MTTALEQIGRRSVATTQQISQTTAVEQARAVAEVAAAVQVAQQNPRDITRARADMQDSCGRMALAQRAFYRVPNRGEGESVHLARALARIWGNIDYGVRELRRDDNAAESEVLAFAWDQETNSRSSRSFINPHARMKKVQGQQTREALFDLHDIYLSNQNIGARAVREAIFAVLPEWFVEEAVHLCRRTLEHGEGIPLDQRIENMVGKFREIGVKVDQIEAKLEKKRGRWTAGDVASMAVLFGSIQRGDVTRDEEFPPARLTAADVTRARRTEPPQPPDDEPASSAPEGITAPQLRKLHAALGNIGLFDRDARLEFLSDQTGRQITTSKELTKAEASRVIDELENPDEPALPMEDPSPPAWDEPVAPVQP
jgi:hypothetical protein